MYFLIILIGPDEAQQHLIHGQHGLVGGLHFIICLTRINSRCCVLYNIRCCLTQCCVFRGWILETGDLLRIIQHKKTTVRICIFLYIFHIYYSISPNKAMLKLANRVLYASEPHICSVDSESENRIYFSKHIRIIS